MSESGVKVAAAVAVAVGGAVGVAAVAAAAAAVEASGPLAEKVPKARGNFLDDVVDGDSGPFHLHLVRATVCNSPAKKKTRTRTKKTAPANSRAKKYETCFAL